MDKDKPKNTREAGMVRNTTDPALRAKKLKDYRRAIYVTQTKIARES